MQQAPLSTIPTAIPMSIPWIIPLNIPYTIPWIRPLYCARGWQQSCTDRNKRRLTLKGSEGGWIKMHSSSLAEIYSACTLEFHEGRHELRQARFSDSMHCFWVVILICLHSCTNATGSRRGISNTAVVSLRNWTAPWPTPPARQCYSTRTSHCTALLPQVETVPI